MLFLTYHGLAMQGHKCLSFQTRHAAVRMAPPQFEGLKTKRIKYTVCVVRRRKWIEKMIE
jgi:hypothetical protein